MTDIALTGRRGLDSVADTALKGAARLWFLVAVIGQWIFVYYIVVYFGGLTLNDGVDGLKNSHLPNGFVLGDTIGNFAVAGHLMLAAIIIGFGPLQLIPGLRNRAPTFHHWNGRIYITAVCSTSIVGLYMVWTRGTVGGLDMHLGISLNAVLILVFAAMTLRYAIARKIHIHRQWALRLFMVVSGVWFFRIGFMLWMLLTGGIGIDMKSFTGPFLTFIAFADYLLPLAILEIYLRTKDRAGAQGRLAMAAGLVVLTGFMGIGIFAAATGMWLPRL